MQNLRPDLRPVQGDPAPTHAERTRNASAPAARRTASDAWRVTVGRKEPDLLRPAGDAHEVDAVSVSCTVGQVVAQVRAVDRDALAIGENAHVVPIDLRVTEAWPAVHLRLPHELVPRAVFGAGEQQLASVAVEE